jgi:hypothetical protein
MFARQSPVRRLNPRHIMAEDANGALTPSKPAHPPTHEPIPGEYDGTTLTHREPGAIGGSFNGDDLVSSRTWIDGETAREQAQGGGLTSGELDRDQEDADGRRST